MTESESEENREMGAGVTGVRRVYYYACPAGRSGILAGVCGRTLVFSVVVVFLIASTVHKRPGWKPFPYRLSHSKSPSQAGKDRFQPTRSARVRTGACIRACVQYGCLSVRRVFLNERDVHAKVLWTAETGHRGV